VSGLVAAARRLLARAVDLRLLQVLAEPVMALVFALIVGGIGIALFSAYVPGHSAFDFGLPIAA
jgi:hypothetical protein